MKRCKCDDGKYMRENGFMTVSCWLGIWWVGFEHVQKAKDTISRHVKYCPFCGKKLPKYPVESEKE